MVFLEEDSKYVEGSVLGPLSSVLGSVSFKTYTSSLSLNSMLLSIAHVVLLKMVVVT